MLEMAIEHSHTPVAKNLHHFKVFVLKMVHLDWLIYPKFARHLEGALPRVCVKVGHLGDGNRALNHKP